MALANTDCAAPWNRQGLESSPSSFCCHVATTQIQIFQSKRLADRALGVLLLALTWPLLLVLVAAVKLSSRGPAIYRQTRVGLGGRIFTMYKLRTMRQDAEAATGPRWAAAGNDPRITPLGVWLRRLHLDELPQLYNLIRGDMALVGPRPERPEFVTVLARQIPGYLDRLQVLPGITGLAQVNLPPDTDLDSVRRKLVLDLDYICTAGIVLDARIVLCTFLRVCGIRHGRAVALLGLTRVVELPSATSGEMPALTPRALVGAPHVSMTARDAANDASSRQTHSDPRELIAARN
jgi:lipopolysaccharide/colanic/teichoic acid biosynthesis glycosyltransferase